MRQTSAYADLTNERVLFILNRNTGIAPYSHHFVLGGIDPQVLSGFVAAMGSFMTEVTGTEQKGWKTVYGSDSAFLVESGEWSLGVLAVLRETNEIRSKLRLVVREFENNFQSLRYADGIDGSVFREFDRYVKQVFVESRLSERTVLMKGSDWRKFEIDHDSPREAFNIAKFLAHAIDGQSVGEAAKSQGVDLDEAIGIVSKANWNNALYFKYSPGKEAILSLSEGSSSILLRHHNLLDLSSKTIQIVGALNGRAPLSEHLVKLESKAQEKVLLELGDLINRGFVQSISLEKKLVLVNECILRNLVKTCIDAVGLKTSLEYFQNALEPGIASHPWISRVWLSKDGRVDCVFEETMSPDDLDWMYDATEFLYKNIAKQIKEDTSDEITGSLLESTLSQCYEKWNPYLGSGML